MLYPRHFLDAMMDLYKVFSAAGAKLVASSSTESFDFTHSRAVVDGLFIGLALDQYLQHLLADQRIDDWLEQVLPLLMDPKL